MLLLRYLVAPRLKPDSNNAPTRVPDRVCPQSKTAAKTRGKADRTALTYHHRPRSTQRPATSPPTMKLFDLPPQQQNSEQNP